MYQQDLYPHLFQHKRFVVDELKRLIPAGSFASHMWQAIGAELYYRLVDWPDEREIEFSRHCPVAALAESLSGGWSLDPEWLADEDGSYSDDNGIAISSLVVPTYSNVEQLAALGLHFATEINDRGPIVEEGYNAHGFTREELEWYET